MSVNFQPATSYRAQVERSRALEEERYLQVVMKAAGKETLDPTSPWFGRSPEFIYKNWGRQR